MSRLGIDTSVTRHGQRCKMAFAAASKTVGSVMSWLGIDTSVDRQEFMERYLAGAASIAWKAIGSTKSRMGFETSAFRQNKEL